ncbi:unnamed protein product, partial [Adineta ricciae]
ADCDAAAAVVPVVYASSDLGRATQVAALALKARVLLYKASPLNNGGNNGLWQAAADAAQEVMAYGPPPGTGDYDLYNDYYKICFHSILIMILKIIDENQLDYIEHVLKIKIDFEYMKYLKDFVYQFYLI